MKELDEQNQTPLHLACSNGSFRVFKTLLESPKIKLYHLCSDSYKFLPLHSLCRSTSYNSNDDDDDDESSLIVMMVKCLLDKTIELKLIVEYYAEKTGHRHKLQNLSLNQVFVKSLLPQVVERLTAHSLLFHQNQNLQQSSRKQQQQISQSLNARNENKLGLRNFFFFNFGSFLVI